MRIAAPHRHPQMRDAGLEVILEAGHGAGELLIPFPDQTGSEVTGIGPGRRLVCGAGLFTEPGPCVLPGDLGLEIAHAVKQAALALRAREAGLDRLDDAGRAVAVHQQRVAEAVAPHLEEGGNRLIILLRSRHEVEKKLSSFAGRATGGQNRLAPLARADPLRDAVDITLCVEKTARSFPMNVTPCTAQYAMFSTWPERLKRRRWSGPHAMVQRAA